MAREFICLYFCEENDLQATFNRSGYPLTMTVRPL